MYNINQVGTDEFKVVKCGNGSLQLWFGQTLAHIFTDGEGFNTFVQTLQESKKILGTEPKMQIPVGYYPGQAPNSPWGTGSTPNLIRPLITSQTGNIADAASKGERMIL